MAWHVVIAGGGFGGFYAASTLVRSLPPHSASVTLVTDTTSCSTRRCCPVRGGGSLEPRHVVVPLRDAAARHRRPAARARRRRRPVAQRRDRTHGRGRDRGDRLRPPRRERRLGQPDAPDPRAGRARARVQVAARGDRAAQPRRAHLEIAETIDDLERRKQYLNYVFVGAGYAGLEGLAELQDFAADLIDLYPRCRVSRDALVLVEATGRVMPEISEGLAEFAMRELRARGIEFRIEHDARVASPSTARDALRRRGHPDAHARLDGGRQAASRRRASSGCR